MGNEPIFTGVGAGGLGQWAPRKNSEIIDISDIISRQKTIKVPSPFDP